MLCVHLKRPTSDGYLSCSHDSDTPITEEVKWQRSLKRITSRGFQVIRLILCVKNRCLKGNAHWHVSNELPHPPATSTTVVIRSTCTSALRGTTRSSLESLTTVRSMRGVGMLGRCQTIKVLPVLLAISPMLLDGPEGSHTRACPGAPPKNTRAHGPQSHFPVA